MTKALPLREGGQALPLREDGQSEEEPKDQGYSTLQIREEQWDWLNKHAKMLATEDTKHQENSIQVQPA